MLRRSRTFGIVALVLALGLGAFAWQRCGLTTAVLQGRGPAPAASRIAVGKRLIFAVEVDATQSASTMPGVNGQLSVRARLELDLERLDRQGGTASIRLVPERDMRFDVLGQQLLGANEATAVILGRARWDGRGALERLEIGNSISDVQAALLAALLRQILVSDQCERTATRIGVPLGLGVAHYSLSALDGAGRSRRLSTVTLALPLLDGDQQVTVRHAEGRVECQEGFPVSLGDDSDVVVLNSQGAELARLGNALRLRLLAIEIAHIEGPRPNWREVNFDGGGSPKRSLEQRAQGLTGDQVVADLQRFSNAGRMLSTPRWLWQATARLALEPQHLTRLGELLKSEVLVDTGRAFVADLLAFTPAPEAQAVLRAALALPPPGVDATEHALLLQRFAFVAHPTTTTLAWLAELRHDAPAGEPVWQATTIALGSALGRLTVGPEQTRYLDLLLAEIGAAEAEEPLACLLRAVGNTALLAPAPIVRARAHHASLLVRAAVASALRHQGDATSLDVLLALAGDEAAFVQRHALSSLRPQALTGSQYAALEAIFRRMPDSVLDDAVSFLAARRQRGLSSNELSAWRSLTTVLLQRAQGNGPVEVRLAALLHS